MAQAVTDQSFEQEVLKQAGVVVVDFWAPWCGPCRFLSPIVEQIGTEYQGRAKVVKLNVDENPLTTSRYGIQGIPTLLFFKDGQLVHQLVGAHPKAVITRALDELLA